MAHLVTPGGRIIVAPDTNKYTPIERRYKILTLLVAQLQSEHLMGKMIELALMLDEEHPKAEEALTYYENSIIAILEA